MRLIDADAVIKKLQEYVTEMESDIYYGSNLGIPEDSINDAIKEVPTIEAEPVRHGHWISYGRDSAYNNFYRCSVCNKEIVRYCESGEQLYGYCPNCGTKMEGENDGRE